MRSTHNSLFGGALFSAGRGERTEHKMRGSGSRALALALAATGTLVFVSPAQADTIHVPRDFETIQAAIDAAVDFDEIIVAPGEYVETIDFTGKTIVVRSAGGRDVTTIDGNDAGTVVTCANGEGAGTTLDGFTVANGYAEEGAGMRNVNSSPTVTNCTFTDNYAIAGGNKRGGGVFNDNSVATFSGCTFFANVAEESGGGMFNLGSDVTILECAFVENQAWSDDGGGCFNQDSDVVFTSSSFSANDACDNAGAMVHDGGSLIIDRCEFLFNQSCYNIGALEISSGTPAIVTNCLFAGNEVDDLKGVTGALRAGDSSTIVNCTFTNHWAGCCGTLSISSTAVVSNCIVDDDGFEPICGFGNISFSLVSDGWEGEGNIKGDPLFVDRDKGDYRLAVGSPCIDAGNNNAVPRGVKFDLDGNPRFVDAPCTDDTGTGRPPIVDMGAFEFQPVDADCNANGVPDECDIADGGSADCNGNGVPDECELFTDCNDNGVFDGCDIADGTSADCNENGIPDECDIADGSSQTTATASQTNASRRSATSTVTVMSMAPTSCFCSATGAAVSIAMPVRTTSTTTATSGRSTSSSCWATGADLRALRQP